jgi:rhamnulokinase
MTHTFNLLALDLGAESGRAMLGQFDGERIQLSEVHRFTNLPVRLPAYQGQMAGSSRDDGYHLHWDILNLWMEIQHGLGLAAQRGPLAGMGLDTWGVDFGLFDKQGALIGNPYHYRDDRTEGMLEEAFRRVPREEIFAQTGIQFMQLNSLYQLLAMVTQRSPALEIAHTFLTMPDIFNYWLTGRLASEFTIATTTQCYNPLQKDWARPMLHKLGIPAHIFPDIVPPGTVLGDLTQDVAKQAGICPLPVIAPACHDTGSAVAAVPAQAPDHIWISSGTWSLIGATITEPLINAQSLDFNLTNEGGVNGTFRLLKNVTGLWLVQECRRTWALQGQEYSYDDLARLAENAAPFLAFVDPDAPDFFNPGDMPSRMQALCAKTGQPVPDSLAAILRCALESLALKYRWVLEKLEALLGRRMEIIHIVGGGAKNRLLNQLTANATGRPVITGPVEATAIGNLLVQAIALGEIASADEGREIVCRSFDVETFEPVQDGDWEAAYERFLEIIE